MGTGPNEQNRLYLRFPCKIEDKHQVLALHPKISIVHLPRQKSRRWCTIECENLDDLAEVGRTIKECKIAGKSIKVKPFTGPKNATKEAATLSKAVLKELLA